MIRTQQESIDTLKQMLSQLLKDEKKPKGKTPSKKSKGKQKEGELIFCKYQDEEHSNSEPPKPSSERRITQRTRAVISRR